MKLLKSGVFYLTVALLVVALFTEDVEARRKIVRGRKTLSRSYMRQSSLPAWSIVILVAVGELILGGVLYVAMKKIILDQPLTGQYEVVDYDV
ncbi:uncharacterized protein LOC109595564 [Aethina tumida]|uniref:uncharacterized protein LOC109595564 n=1 Tax=Aethina tumida TaxID=116153 RepID=UPI00096B1C9D|nr:uncharacterized protein LOC109595564 [Aethina tumida]